MCHNIVKLYTPDKFVIVLLLFINNPLPTSPHTHPIPKGLPRPTRKREKRKTLTVKMNTKELWQKILHVVITVLTAIATTFGVTSCMGV